MARGVKVSVLAAIGALWSTIALAQTSVAPCISNPAGGCNPVVTTNPLPITIYNAGVAAQVSLDGALGVNTPPQAQFADTFSAALDTTVNWTAKNSTGTAATASGQLVINSSTTASAWGGVTSQQSFAPIGVSPQIFGVLASFTVNVQANTTRVFGVFTVPATPTTAVPATDGYLFRLDGTGNLFAEIWSAGVAVSSTNVTTGCLPSPGFPGIFAIIYRASLVQFTCGSALVTNQPPIFGINPVQQVLPVSALSIAGSTPPAASAVINLSAMGLAALSPGAVKSPNQPPTSNDPYIVVGNSPNSMQTAAFPIQGNGAGTTGAVVGTLAASATQRTYLCDFDVSSAGTGSVGPITVAGLLGGSKVYQLTAPTPLTKQFNPCLPSSAINTAITITTTADASATAVDVNSSGFQQ